MKSQGSQRVQIGEPSRTRTRSVVKRSYSREILGSFYLTQYHSFLGHKSLTIRYKAVKLASALRVLNWAQIKSHLRHHLAIDCVLVFFTQLVSKPLQYFHSGFHVTCKDIMACR